MVAELCVAQLRGFPDEIFNIMNTLVRLHLMSTVNKYLSWYILRGAVGKKAAVKLGNEIRESFRVLHPHVLKLVNSFGVPEHLLTSPVAQDYVDYNSRPNKGEIVNAKL